MATTHLDGDQNSPALFTLDHWIPLSKGGADTRGNIVGACLSCNHEKDDDMPGEELSQLSQFVLASYVLAFLSVTAYVALGVYHVQLSIGD